MPFAIIEQRLARSVRDPPVRIPSRLLAPLSAALLAAAAAATWAQQPPGAHSAPLQPPAGASAAIDAPHPTAQASGAEPGAASTGGAEIPPLNEETPPISSGALLSDAQLRHCLAQSIRIAAVRPLLDRTKVEQVEYLNEMVADFNKRCASQRYPVPALEDAKRVVEANRPLIQADARSAFGKRFGTGTAGAPTPATEAPRQPEPQQPIAQPPSQAVAPPVVETRKVQPESQQALAQSRTPAAAAPQPHTREVTPETSQPSPPVAAEQEAPLELRAEPQPSSAPETAEASAPPATPSPQAPVAPVAAAEPSESPGARAVAQEPPVSKAAARPSAQAPLRDPALERYIREIQRTGSRVLAERDYPPQAKGKGLKGTVQIEVRFSGGYIRSILLGESCGHPALDDKALEIARAVKFPYVPKGLRSREFSVRFPIEFRLRKR